MQKKDTGRLGISQRHLLLFPKQERKVQSEEENQQEEICEEMQGSAQGDCRDANTAGCADNEKAESDTGWLLSLLWDN